MTEIKMQDVVPNTASMRRTGKLARRGALITPSPTQQRGAIPPAVISAIGGQDVEVTEHRNTTAAISRNTHPTKKATVPKQ